MTRTDLDSLRRLISHCQDIDRANDEDGDIAAGQLLTRRFSDLIDAASSVVIHEMNAQATGHVEPIKTPIQMPEPANTRVQARLLELERLVTIVRGEMRVVKDWMVHAQAKVLQAKGKGVEVSLTPTSRSTKTKSKTRSKRR